MLLDTYHERLHNDLTGNGKSSPLPCPTEIEMLDPNNLEGACENWISSPQAAGI